MTPKKGLPKFIAQMWDIEKLMWFDESFLKDPNGFDAELTVESFLGPMIVLMMKPLIMVLFFPFFYLWQELAFWSQLLMFVIFGWTRVDAGTGNWRIVLWSGPLQAYENLRYLRRRRHGRWLRLWLRRWLHLYASISMHLYGTRRGLMMKFEFEVNESKQWIEYLSNESNLIAKYPGKYGFGVLGLLSHLANVGRSDNSKTKSYFCPI